MIHNNLAIVCCGLSIILDAAFAGAADRNVLHGHLLPISGPIQPLRRLAETNRLELVLGLKLRNPEDRKRLLDQIYDPTSPNYHKYLSVPELTDRFGPSEQDYEALADFANSNGLRVVNLHSNRTLIDVSGLVSDIEKVFHTRIMSYSHPTENREFYAPEVEPSVDADLPLLAVSGLHNFVIPHHRRAATALTPGSSAQTLRGPHETKGGSGPWGTYIGTDYRKAYAPGVNLTGAGQIVGLIEFDGYYSNDIVAYATLAGLPHPSVTNILLNGVSGAPSDRGEAPMDIEQVISMAPNTSVLVYEGIQPNDILNRMYTDGLVNQISDSLVYGWDANTMQIYQQLAARGVSYFMASGDYGADTMEEPVGPPYVTSVGGTILTTAADGSWLSETSWRNDAIGWASGGGASPYWPLPSWQVGVDMSVNHGSFSHRNFPDVAMAAENIFGVAANGQYQLGHGTSFAAPLWAGFMALVNQKASQAGYPPAGFLNPAIYAVGKGSDYSACFHDITTGNNTNSSPDRYFAVTGYDLCTGWGTPKGIALLNNLSGIGSAVWVSFGNANPGNGTYDLPYNTLGRATNAVAPGGVIAVKTVGTTSELMKIAKPMQIRAIGGGAVIGR